MDEKTITRTQTIEEAVTNAVGAQGGDWFWTVAMALSRIAELEKELAEAKAKLKTANDEIATATNEAALEIGRLRKQLRRYEPAGP